ncbi:MAG: polysaccharide biosynthesis protein [Cyclobacteriaceae bacterium]
MDSSILKIRILPRWIIIIIDILIVFFSSLLAFLLRFNFDYSKFNDYHVNQGIFLFVVFSMFSSLITKSYAGIVRYTGVQDAGRILITIALTTGFTLATSFIRYYYMGDIILPASVAIIAFFTSIIFLFAYRLAVKQLFSYFFRPDRKKAGVVIFGTTRTGLIARQIIENDSKNAKKVVVFFDDHRQKVGKIIDGIKIYDAKRDFEKVIHTFDVKEYIIADAGLSVERKNAIVDDCLRAGIKVRIVPPVDHWIKGELSPNQIREINIEELLGRESIKLDNRKIKADVKGKRVLVTGAAGSIGSEIVRQILYYLPEAVILVDQAESPLFELNEDMRAKKGTVEVVPVIGDVTNEERMDSIFEEFKPDVVYHAAAYKHVPLMERNPFEAVLCNIKGTKTLADISVKHGVKKFVMISTDKAVNPTNVMGASKRIAEIYVQSLNNYLTKTNPDSTRFITTRFGNVLGSNGSVIPLFKKQILKGGPITVTHPEITRFFMTIPEACQLVLEAGAMGEGGEIFVFDMGKSVKIVDLARKMISLSGFQPGKEIEIVYTGLRSGEKLYEEVLSSKENSMPTYHHKILISRTREFDFETVKHDLSNLIDAAYDRDDLKLVGIMKFIVPEYKSKQSKFEILDGKRQVIS